MQGAILFFLLLCLFAVISRRGGGWVRDPVETVFPSPSGNNCYYYYYYYCERRVFIFALVFLNFCLEARDTLLYLFLVVPVFSGNVSRALLSFLSLSWAFSISGFFYAGASETQRWSLT